MSSVGIAEQSGQKLASLIPQIHTTAQLVHKISLSSAEQDMAAEQIDIAVQRLTKVVQENALAEQLAFSSEELTGQAHSLTDAVAIFKTSSQSLPEARKIRYN